MLPLLRLIRFPNLLVVALTQWLIAVPVLGAALIGEGLEPSLTQEELFLLIIATCCVTAAGYVINDLLDHNIDLVNRPGKVIVGQYIGIGTVSWLVSVFAIVGFICSLILAFSKQELEWLWLYPLILGLLGWYPNIFKRRPFAGNLLVAICCAGVAGLVWLAERSGWEQLPVAVKLEVRYILLLFMSYAFLATWIREIVKDMEDTAGDKLSGRETLPLSIGINSAKHIIYFLSFLLALSLLFNCLKTSVLVVIFSVFLLISLMFMTRLLMKANSSDDYHRLSTQWKFYLLGGLLLLFFYQL
jgi:4-hydroxybenzoate polyprenyltransferase